MMKQDHPSHNNDDNFDDFLAKHLMQTQLYLADDDFTARVMQQLPAPKKLARWQERLIIVIPLVIISLLVLSQFSVLAVAIKLWVLFTTADVQWLFQIGLLTTIAVISSATLWFAKQLKFI